MLQFKKKKDHVGKSGGNRILIKINVVGSAGPIRFVVDEDELVASVINIAIKMYAREGRLPVLGTKLNEFFLYTPIAGSEALSPWEMIGSFGVRNFLLCKKQSQLTEATEITRKSSSRWKSWFNKSLSLKITTH
ncbi:hypothetical protein Tco_0994965 [Tanacetum coccineum]